MEIELQEISGLKDQERNQDKSVQEEPLSRGEEPFREEESRPPEEHLNDGQEAAQETPQETTQETPQETPQEDSSKNPKDGTNNSPQPRRKKRKKTRFKLEPPNLVSDFFMLWIFNLIQTSFKISGLSFFLTQY